jgi:hypothetical protein
MIPRYVVFDAKKIQVVVFWVVTPCSDVIGCHVQEDLAASIFTPSPYHFILKMEAARSSETLVSCVTSQKTRT